MEGFIFIITHLDISVTQVHALTASGRSATIMETDATTATGRLKVADEYRVTSGINPLPNYSKLTEISVLRLCLVPLAIDLAHAAAGQGVS